MTSTNEPTITFDSFGETMTCKMVTDRYTNGRLCLTLLYWDDEMEGWFPHCKVTVNMPDIHLNEGEVLIKDWAENEEVAIALKQQGWITPAGREVSSGFVFPMVARLTGPLEGMK